MAVDLAQRFAASFEAISGPRLEPRNAQMVLAYGAAAVEYAIYRAIMGQAYVSGSSATLTIFYVAASATSGTARIRVSFERQAVNGQDIDSDGFASTQEVNATADATSGEIFTASFTLSNANMDAVAVGNMFRLKIERVGNDDTNDTMTGDLQMLGWALTQ